MGTLQLKSGAGIGALGLTALAITASPATADTIQIASDMVNSTEHIASFEGTIDYTVNGMVGNLVVSLTNTTDSAEGGYLTGFVFNVEGKNASVELTSAPNSSFKETDGKASPFGHDYEAGAALGGKFLGGGSPKNGLAIGDTGIFTFDVIGPDASGLTASSFVSGTSEFDFVVRFKGMESGSDKVPLTAVVVPLPAPLAMGLVGLAGVGLARRRRFGL